MSVLIKRPINGITINGFEYVLDENGNEITFDTLKDAKTFLAQHGYDENTIDAEGIEFEEVAE